MLYYRSYGHEKDSTSTYAMISGMFNSGWALGAMLGPIVNGALTQTLGFPWTITISSFLNLALVSCGLYLFVASMNLREVETLKLILDQQRKIIVNKYFIYNTNLISRESPKSANIIIYIDTKFAQRFIRLGRQFIFYV